MNNIHRQETEWMETSALNLRAFWVILQCGMFSEDLSSGIIHGLSWSQILTWDITDHSCPTVARQPDFPQLIQIFLISWSWYLLSQQSFTVSAANTAILFAGWLWLSVEQTDICKPHGRTPLLTSPHLLSQGDHNHHHHQPTSITDTRDPFTEDVLMSREREGVYRSSDYVTM